jgi:hypothetical protein
MGTGHTQEKGLVQHSLDFIFSHIKEYQSEFIIKASFIEIYNEEIKDLCNVKNKKNIIIRESRETSSVNLIGVSELPVNDSQDAINLLMTGLMNRKTASTLSNDTSSRSHAIYTLNIERVSEIASAFKINFIDLAGSERLKKSGAKGDRLKESVSINSGLLALSKVIMALSNLSKKSKSSELSNSVVINNSISLNMSLAGNNSAIQNNGAGLVHIPYRESKLTRILKDSLGGSSITLMIPCVSPSINTTDETINTLNYASFAKSIKITPMIRQVYNDEESLRKENEALKKELEKYKNSKLEAENFKLKGIVKLLKKTNNISINSQTNDLNLLGLDPKELEHFLNASFDDDKESNAESNNEYPNEIEEISNMYKRDSKIHEDNKIIEIEYSEKIKENIRLREDNEILKEEIKKYKIKEEDYENKLNFAAKFMNEQDFSKFNNSNNFFNHDEKIKISNKNNSNLLSAFYKKEFNDQLDRNHCKSNSAHKDPSHSQENKLRKTGNKENNLNKRLLNKSVDGLKQVNKQTINTGDSQLNSINEKIKKLREFQNSLKRKLQETEIHKNKVIRNKNEEITYIKREVYERTKQVKNLEKLNERNNELIEKSENTINVLKEDLRNKSLEISKIKKIEKSQDQNTTNIITNNITTNIVNNEYSVNNITSTSENSLSNVINKIKEKKKIHKERKKSQIISVNNTLNQSQSHADYYYQIKNLIKNMEELIINKHKLEKRLNYMKKEKKDFLKLMDVNHEKIKTKLNTLTKQRNDISNLLMLDEKEKINLTHKYQVILNKINSLNNRLEKIEYVKESTLSDIGTNEENLKSEIAEITQEISKIKSKISNYGEEKKKIQLSDLEISGDNEVTNEYKNIIREKEEKLVFIELDNIYKEKKIHELEKNLKETINRYEDELLKLKVERESSKKEIHKNESNTIDMDNYQPEGISRSQSDFLLDEESMSCKKQINLPPKITTNCTGKEKKTICVVKLKSTINELTSSPRRDERRGIPRALVKNKSFDNFMKKTK